MTTNVDPLPPGQLRIYSQILSFWQLFHYSPSYREIAEPCGITSTNGVLVQLKALRKKGWLHYMDNQARSIVPLRKLDGTRIRWDAIERLLQSERTDSERHN